MSSKVAASPKAPLQPALAKRTGLPNWLAYVLLCLLPLLAYAPMMQAAYIWDDGSWLLNNPPVQDVRNIPRIWLDPWYTPHYYPLTQTTLALEWAMWGPGMRDGPPPQGVLRGVGYHVDNILLHIVAALFLFEVIRRLRLPGGVWAAFLAAGAWEIHPVNVETVAWVAERKNVLCAAFLFPAFLLAIKALGIFEPQAAPAEPASAGTGTREVVPQETKDARRFAWGAYAGAIVLFLLSMLSKTTGCFLPPALLVMFWWRKGRISRREVALTVPFFAIALGLGLVTAWLEKAHAGARGALFDFSFFQRCLIAANSFWFYIGKIIWPDPVYQIYPRFDIHAGKPVTDVLLFLGLAAYVLTAIWLVALWKKSRAPVAVFLLFTLGIFPAMGFIPFYTQKWTFVMDHYQYLACPVIIVAAVEMLAWILRRVFSTMKSGEQTARLAKLIPALSGGGLLAALGLLSFGISSLYTDEALLWGFSARHNPKSAFVLSQYALALLKKPDVDVDFVQQLIREAISAEPDSWHGYDARVQFFRRMGDATQAAIALHEVDIRLSEEEREQRTRMFEELREQVEAGIKRSPEFLRARDAERAGQWDQAIDLYREAAGRDPADEESNLRRGFCMQVGKSDLSGAMEVYQAILTRNPDYADAWLFLGVAQRVAGKEQEAMESLKKAQSLGGEQVLLRHPELMEIRK